MITVGAYEAKTHLSRLLDLVVEGEIITITRHGVPVAVMQPPVESRTTDPGELISELRKFRESHPLDGLSIRDMIEEGRR